MSSDDIHVLPGAPAPLGANLVEGGVNFALYSSAAEAVDLCLFDGGGTETARVSLPERSGDVWHGFVPGIAAGQHYGYRVHGRYAPHHGHRFNEHKLLIDPYARRITDNFEWRPEIFGYTPEEGHAWQKDPRDSAPWVPRSVVVDRRFDWQGVGSPAVPWNRSVIYELHVKGLHPSASGRARATPRHLSRARTTGGAGLSAEPRRDRGRADAVSGVLEREPSAGTESQQLLGL